MKMIYRRRLLTHLGMAGLALSASAHGKGLLMAAAPPPPALTGTVCMECLKKRAIQRTAFINKERT